MARGAIGFHIKFASGLGDLRRRRDVLAFAAILLASSLTWIHASIAQSIQFISTIEAAKLLSNPRAAVLLDIRERDEFIVSRIAGALNVTPATPSEQTAKRLARIVSGKAVIVYCTTGVRSTDFAVFADADLRAAGAKSILVLSGGIIAWHNEGRWLVNRGGQTKLIHPFRKELVQSLKRPEFARISP